MRRYLRAFVSFSGRFLANGSHPAGCAPPTRSARNARARRRHVVAAARILQRCRRMASPRRIGRASAGFRRPFNWRDEESRIVDLNLADAVRRPAAARWTHSHISRSYCTPSLGHACAARREEPSHAAQQADGASLSPTDTSPFPCDATKPTAWRRGSAHPAHLIRCYDRVLLRATIGSGRDVAYADTRKRANELEQPRIGSSRMQEGEPEGARFGSGQVRLVNIQPDCRARGRGGGPRAWHIETPSRMRRAEH